MSVDRDYIERFDLAVLVTSESECFHCGELQSVCELGKHRPQSTCENLEVF